MRNDDRKEKEELLEQHLGKQEERGSNAPAGGQNLDHSVAFLTGEKVEDAGIDKGRGEL